jgi:predicted dehydrogenase
MDLEKAAPVNGRMRMEKKRFGVIGVGGWGSRHIATYQDHPLVDVVALCDLNRKTLDKVGKEFDIPKRYTDHEEMLSKECLDAVSIVTPDFAHADLAVAAIEAGVSILIEKPLATTTEDCKKIGKALKKRPVRFMVDFHNRWNPSMVKFHKTISHGEIGDVQMAYYRLSDNISVPTGMLSWAARSSVNWFLASHCLDTLMWLFNDDVAEVFTVSRSRVLKPMGINTPDFYQSILQFRKGAVATLENCWILAGSHALIDLKIEVVGSKGTLFFDGRPHMVEQYGMDKVEWPDVYVCPTIHGHPRGFGVDSIHYFADCVVFDRPVPCGFEEGRKVTEVILAMEKSAASGRPVRLRSN